MILSKIHFVALFYRLLSVAKLIFLPDFDHSGRPEFIAGDLAFMSIRHQQIESDVKIRLLKGKPVMVAMVVSCSAMRRSNAKARPSTTATWFLIP